MNRTKLSLISLFTVVFATGGPLLAADDTKLAEVRAKMDEMFQEIRPEHVNASPINGWYTVQKGSIVAYVSEDGRYLLQGDLIDLDRNVNLSEVSRTDARRPVEKHPRCVSRGSHDPGP